MPFRGTTWISPEEEEEQEAYELAKREKQLNLLSDWEARYQEYQTGMPSPPTPTKPDVTVDPGLPKEMPQTDFQKYGFTQPIEDIVPRKRDPEYVSPVELAQKYAQQEQVPTEVAERRVWDRFAGIDTHTGVDPVGKTWAEEWGSRIGEKYGESAGQVAAASGHSAFAFANLFAGVEDTLKHATGFGHRLGSSLVSSIKKVMNWDEETMPEPLRALDQFHDEMIQRFEDPSEEFIPGITWGREAKAHWEEFHRRAQMYDEREELTAPLSTGIVMEGLHTASEVGSLILQMAAAGKLGAAASVGKYTTATGQLMPGVSHAAPTVSRTLKGNGIFQGMYRTMREGITATQKMPAAQRQQILGRMQRVGGHGLVATEGEYEDRIISATQRLAYNITPYIANATGLTGLKAVGTDFMLNFFLTSPAYLEALDEAGGFTSDFWSFAIPQMVMDVFMARGTRGLAEMGRWEARQERIKAVAQDRGVSEERAENMVRFVEEAIEQTERVQGERIDPIDYKQYTDTGIVPPMPTEQQFGLSPRATLEPGRARTMAPEEIRERMDLIDDPARLEAEFAGMAGATIRPDDVTRAAASFDPGDREYIYFREAGTNRTGRITGLKVKTDPDTGRDQVTVRYDDEPETSRTAFLANLKFASPREPFREDPTREEPELRTPQPVTREALQSSIDAGTQLRVVDQEGRPGTVTGKKFRKGERLTVRFDDKEKSEIVDVADLRIAPEERPAEAPVARPEERTPDQIDRRIRELEAGIANRYATSEERERMRAELEQLRAERPAAPTPVETTGVERDPAKGTLDISERLLPGLEDIRIAYWDMVPKLLPPELGIREYKDGTYKVTEQTPEDWDKSLRSINEAIKFFEEVSDERDVSVRKGDMPERDQIIDRVAKELGREAISDPLVAQEAATTLREAERVFSGLADVAKQQPAPVTPAAAAPTDRVDEAVSKPTKAPPPDTRPAPTDKEIGEAKDFNSKVKQGVTGQLAVYANKYKMKEGDRKALIHTTENLINEATRHGIKLDLKFGDMFDKSEKAIKKQLNEAAKAWGLDKIEREQLEGKVDIGKLTSNLVKIGLEYNYSPKPLTAGDPKPPILKSHMHELAHIYMELLKTGNPGEYKEIFDFVRGDTKLPTKQVEEMIADYLRDASVMAGTKAGKAQWKAEETGEARTPWAKLVRDFKAWVQGWVAEMRKVSKPFLDQLYSRQHPLGIHTRRFAEGDWSLAFQAYRDSLRQEAPKTKKKTSYSVTPNNRVTTLPGTIVVEHYPERVEEFSRITQPAFKIERRTGRGWVVFDERRPDWVFGSFRTEDEAYNRMVQLAEDQRRHNIMGLTPEKVQVVMPEQITYVEDLVYTGRVGEALFELGINWDSRLQTLSFDRGTIDRAERILDGVEDPSRLADSAEQAVARHLFSRFIDNDLNVTGLVVHHLKDHVGPKYSINDARNENERLAEMYKRDMEKYAPTFYIEMGDVAREVLPPKGERSQVENLLRKHLRPDEIRETEIMAHLRDQYPNPKDKVPREFVLEHAKQFEPTLSDLKILVETPQERYQRERDLSKANEQIKEDPELKKRWAALRSLESRVAEWEVNLKPEDERDIIAAMERTRAEGEREQAELTRRAEEEGWSREYTVQRRMALDDAVEVRADDAAQQVLADRYPEYRETREQYVQARHDYQERMDQLHHELIAEKGLDQTIIPGKTLYEDVQRVPNTDELAERTSGIRDTEVYFVAEFVYPRSLREADLPEGYKVQRELKPPAMDKYQYYIESSEGQQFPRGDTRYSAMQKFYKSFGPEFRPPQPLDRQFGHFGSPNELMFVRGSIRPDHKGDKVLVLEQVQSDVHGMSRIAMQRSATDEEGRQLIDEAGRPIIGAVKDRHGDIQRRWSVAEVGLEEPMVLRPMPFQKTWPELGMKWAMRFAAENDIREIYWPTGSQQRTIAGGSDTKFGLIYDKALVDPINKMSRRKGWDFQVEKGKWIDPEALPRPVERPTDMRDLVTMLDNTERQSLMRMLGYYRNEIRENMREDSPDVQEQYMREIRLVENMIDRLAEGPLERVTGRELSIISEVCNALPEYARGRLIQHGPHAVHTDPRGALEQILPNLTGTERESLMGILNYEREDLLDNLGIRQEDVRAVDDPEIVERVALTDRLARGNLTDVSHRDINIIADAMTWAPENAAGRLEHIAGALTREAAGILPADHKQDPLLREDFHKITLSDKAIEDILYKGQSLYDVQNRDTLDAIRKRYKQLEESMAKLDKQQTKEIEETPTEGEPREPTPPVPKTGIPPEPTLQERFTKEQRAEIRKERNEIEKILKHESKYGPIRPEYKQAIEAVFDGVDWKVTTKRTDKKMKQLASIKKYVEENPDHILPHKVLKDLDAIDKKPLSEFTYGEVMSMFTAAKQLAHNNMMKQQLIMGKRVVDQRKKREEAVKMIKEAHPYISDMADPQVILSGAQTRTRPGRIQNLKGMFNEGALLPENLSIILQGKDVSILAGRDQQGAVKEIMYDGINQGYTDRFRVFYDAQDHAREVIEKHLGHVDNVLPQSKYFVPRKKDLDLRRIRLTDDEKTGKRREIELTRDQMMELYAHSKNDFNRRNICHKDGGIRIEGDERTPPVILKPQDLVKIIEAMPRADQKIVDDIFEYVNTTLRNKGNEVSLRLDGFHVFEEKNYWPLNRWGKDVAEPELKGPRAHFNRYVLEEMGVLKDREYRIKPVLVKGFWGSYWKYLDEISRYVGHAESLRNAKMLMDDRDFIAAMSEAGKMPWYGSLKSYLQDVEGNIRDMTPVEKFFRKTLDHIHRNILGLNPAVMLKQPTSYLAAGTEIDMKYLMKAAPTRIAHAVKEMEKYSPQNRYRLEGKITREMSEIGEMGQVLQFFTGKTFASRKVTEGIKFFDKQTVGRLWNAVKMEIKDKYPDLTGDAFFKKVAERHEEIINRTQPTYLPHTRSEIGRSPNLYVRIFAPFHTQRNKNYNIKYKSLWKFAKSEKQPSDYADLFKMVMLMMVASPMWLTSVDELRDKTYNRHVHRTTGRKALEHASYIIGNAYGVGSIFDTVYGRLLTDTRRGYDLTMGDPISATLQELADAFTHTGEWINDVVSQEAYERGLKEGELKANTSLMRAMDSILTVAGKFTGIPYSNVRSITGGTISNMFPNTEIKVDGVTRNPQSSYYYNKFWEQLDMGDERGAARTLNILIDNFKITQQDLRNSAIRRELDRETYEKALDIARQERN